MKVSPSPPSWARSASSSPAPAPKKKAWRMLSRTEVALRLFSASETLGLGVVKSEGGAHGSGSSRPDDTFIPLRAPATTESPRVRGQITMDLTAFWFWGPGWRLGHEPSEGLQDVQPQKGWKPLVLNVNCGLYLSIWHPSLTGPNYGPHLFTSHPVTQNHLLSDLSQKAILSHPKSPRPGTRQLGEPLGPRSPRIIQTHQSCLPCPVETPIQALT